jgi:hypothetical protein
MVQWMRDSPDLMSPVATATAARLAFVLPFVLSVLAMTL